MRDCRDDDDDKELLLDADVRIGSGIRRPTCRWLSWLLVVVAVVVVMIPFRSG